MSQDENMNQHEESAQNRTPSVAELFLAFLRLGLTAFGGPAMVAYIRDLAVKKHQWVSDRDFRAGVALVQTIPGATAMQAAAYAGLRAAGPAGSLGAYIGFSLPAMILMLALSVLYAKGRELPHIISLFAGLQVIVIAIVANAAWNFGKKTLASWHDVLLTLAGAAFIVLNGSPVTVIVVSAAVAPVLYRNVIGDSGANSSGIHCRPDSHSDFMRSTMRFGIIVSLTVALLLAALFFFHRPLFQLGFMMLKIDFFAYGGGYASLPMMLHETVQARHLLDEKTLMDGIALGQVTPGPIVITATFVGYLLYGIAGALVASICIFTPSFVVLLLVTPWFDCIRENRLFKMVMRGIMCSFTGLLAAVTIRFCLSVQWTPAAFFLCGASLIALRRHIDILWVVLAGGAVAMLAL